MRFEKKWQVADWNFLYNRKFGFVTDDVEYLNILKPKTMRLLTIYGDEQAGTHVFCTSSSVRWPRETWNHNRIDPVRWKRLFDRPRSLVPTATVVVRLCPGNIRHRRRRRLGVHRSYRCRMPVGHRRTRFAAVEDGHPSHRPGGLTIGYCHRRTDTKKRDCYWYTTIKVPAYESRKISEHR